MKTKIAYVATAPVYLTDRRGNVKVLPVGTELAARAYQDLTPNQRAKFSTVIKNTGRARFNGGSVTDLPVVDGVVKTVFVPGEFHQLPVMVHELVNEVAELWSAAHPELPFPGVGVGRYNGGDHHLTWWIYGQGLPAGTTPMFTTSNHLCGFSAKRDRRAGQYPYQTASLLKTAERLRAGRAIFATAEEAIDRVLAG
jgi:hypothetical protein